MSCFLYGILILNSYIGFGSIAYTLYTVKSGSAFSRFAYILNSSALFPSPRVLTLGISCRVNKYYLMSYPQLSQRLLSCCCWEILCTYLLF
jgi:hypothetical protein